MRHRHVQQREFLSRYDLCIEALRRTHRLRDRTRALIQECEKLIAEATASSREHLEDIPSN